jgi:hypothetical protein
MNPIDQKWIDALSSYWGAGTVPYWNQENGPNDAGSVDAGKTIDWMMKARGQKKLDPKTGAEIEWEPNGV